MTNIKTVAEQAGVSFKTVSRVVNGDPKVADETRRRILRVIDELNYRPNKLGRSLVRGKTGVVGVINGAVNDVYSHPFFSDVLHGIADVLSQSDLDVLIHLPHSSNLAYCNLYLEKRVDGLILMSLPAEDPNLAGLAENHVPAVFLCSTAEDSRSIHLVDSDYIGGTSQAMDYLVGQGHHRIGLLAGPRTLISVRMRVHAYQQSLQQHGITADDTVIHYLDFYRGKVDEVVHRLMLQDSPPTALLCGEDILAIKSIRLLQELGYDVPKDISVIGCDDTPVAKLMAPALTTLRQDAYKKGSLAAERLVKLIAGEFEGPITQTLLSMQLIIRDFTGPNRQHR